MDASHLKDAIYCSQRLIPFVKMIIGHYINPLHLAMRILLQVTISQFFCSRERKFLKSQGGCQFEYFCVKYKEGSQSQELPFPTSVSSR